MHRFVALLRAINVGGHVVKMDALRRHFEALDLTDVSTFIASGNVLFNASAARPASLERTIARALEASLGYPVGTFIRTPAQMAAAAGHSPFGPLLAGELLYVGFISAPLDAAGRRALASFVTDASDFAARGTEVYWRRKIGSSYADFSLTRFEQAIGRAATFRNITTVRKLADLVSKSSVPRKRSK